MAVHEPRTWVISLESDDYESIGWEKDNVPTWRIIELQVEILEVETRVVGLLEEGKVVTV